MSVDWTHEFCLGCDRQTDGAAYCSESCRLADYEKTSPLSSPALSPTTTTSSYSWSAKPTSTSSTSPSSSSRFYLSPAYDFASPRALASPSAVPRTQPPLTDPARLLSPSSSQSSLCSMGSNQCTSAEVGQLSEKARKELQAYASSFEQARVQRRRSSQ